MGGETALLRKTVGETALARKTVGTLTEVDTNAPKMPQGEGKLIQPHRSHARSRPRLYSLRLAGWSGSLISSSLARGYALPIPQTANPQATCVCLRVADGLYSLAVFLEWQAQLPMHCLSPHSKTQLVFLQLGLRLAIPHRLPKQPLLLLIPDLHPIAHHPKLLLLLLRLLLLLLDLLLLFLLLLLLLLFLASAEKPSHTPSRCSTEADLDVA